MPQSFSDIVNALNLIYPVAEIAEKTGYDKGNISSYLKGKKEPSKAFLKKFNEVFSIEQQKEEVSVSKELTEILGEHEERLIRLEAHIEVYEKAIIDLQNNDGDGVGKLITLRSQVKLAAARRFYELRK